MTPSLSSPSVLGSQALGAIFPGVQRTDALRPDKIVDEAQEARRGFASVLGRARNSGATGSGDESPEQVARRSAESLVAMTFIQPLLKQLRDTSTAAPPFAPTQGEKQFQGLMDAELAQRMVRKGNFPIVERITQQLLDKSIKSETTH